MSFDYVEGEGFPSEKERSVFEQVRDMSVSELFHHQTKGYDMEVRHALALEIAKRGTDQRGRIEGKLNLIMIHLGMRDDT